MLAESAFVNAVTKEYGLNIVWIGLLKLADTLKISTNNEDIERFELLLNFLCYISSKNGIRPFYLQMLNTVLKVADLSLKSITFPLFTEYNHIQHYTIICRLATSEEKNQIKFLLKSWLLKIYPQQFLQKSIEAHYQIEFQLIYQKLIDEELLENAQKKYFYPNSDYFIKSTTSIEMINKYQNFPDEIVSFVDDENNHRKEIGHFFKNQVSQN